MDPKVEIIEEEQEHDIPVEDIVGAIDEELSAEPAAPEPDPEPAPEPEVEPEPEAAAEPETPAEPEKDAAEPDKEDGEPEVKAEPEPEAKTEGEEKPSDEFGALEEGTPERTRERFETVKGKYDEVIAERDSLIEERDAVKAESDQWVAAITGTGTNPEQFNMSLEYLTLVNSGKPEDLEKAYGIMQGELQELGKTLGKAAPGLYNPLDEHLDLKQKVDDGLMDEGTALEVVRARATTKLNTTTTTARDETAAHDASVSKAMEDVKQLGIQLKASDPHFEAKVEMLAPIIESVVSSGTPPNKWLDTIQKTYAKIPNPAPTAPAPVTPKPTNIPDPIRPTGTSPSSAPMQTEPGSMVEAVTQSLERGY